MPADSPAVPEAFDLLSTATFAEGHPWALYEAMRARGRVLRHPGGGDVPDFWVVAAADDVRAVSHDTEHFSSAAGFNLPVGGRRAPSAVTAALGRNILNYDPPDPTEFKRMLMPAFSPPRIRALEERSRALVAELLDGLKGRDEIEFVAEVASVIPIRVLCELLGIPREDEAKILTWTNRMVGANDPEFSPDPSVAFAAFMEVFEYGRWLIAKRREEPGDDLMSLVAHGELGGQPLDQPTRDGMCVTLIGAGNETTRNAITAAVQMMAQAPDQRDRLAADPQMANNAVEEFLRRSSPVIHMIRTAKEDVVVAGQPIAAGETVALLYGAANHDPALFEAPQILDVGRGNARQHQAFGTGIHLCIGQRVAQVEMRVLLPELLRRYPRLEVTSEPAYMLSNFVCGIKRLNVRLA